MKLNPEIVHKIRAVEIHTRRLLSGAIVGGHNSAKKGFGLDFDQLRSYQVGDDVRHIDWKSTARSDGILVREYTEERNRTIMLVVDGSASLRYGSSEQLKSDIVAQVASVLALVGDYTRDNVGLIIVTNETKQVLPPARGRAHAHRIMETVFMHEFNGITSLRDGIAHVLHMKRNDMIVFVISDFLTDDYETDLKMLGKRNETIAVHCFDSLELQLPDCGLLTVYDPESGQKVTISSKNSDVTHILREQHALIDQTCKRANVDRLSLQVDKPFIGELIKFFRMRMLT